MRVLAGDIGGTKTRLAVFDVHGTCLETVTERSYSSGDYSGLENIVRDFLDGTSADCRQACFGIAGPVQRGRAQVTNLPWIVEEQTLAALFGFERVALINDLEANAWGIGALRENDFCRLNTGSPAAAGNACIISAGTGLGEAGLYWDGQRHWPFACEGGHANFSPSSDLEIALLEFLRERFGRVSWERVISGKGLVNIHDFLRSHRGVPAPSRLRQELAAGDPAAAISRAAKDDRDSVCAEALDLFAHLYGEEAGNHALKIMAGGGVYLGGGIVPKNLERFKGPMFMQGFLDKGRMRALLEAMPVKIILNDRTALYGPALYLAAVKQDTI
ncbi:MAG: glucokinase [bacterium]|nr:glucokinase [bacterium]